MSEILKDKEYQAFLNKAEKSRYYKEIHLRNLLKGLGLDGERVERAIRLSKEKYCSVGATVSGKAKIIIKYLIHRS